MAIKGRNARVAVKEKDKLVEILVGMCFPGRAAVNSYALRCETSAVARADVTLGCFGAYGVRTAAVVGATSAVTRQPSVRASPVDGCCRRSSAAQS